MEKLELTINSLDQLISYRDENHLIKYEPELLNEMINAVQKGDLETLKWFNSFGDSLRAVIMNVYAYRKGLEFGFCKIAFDQYGWFKRPEWLDTEEHTFGDTSRYGNYSTVTLGHGPNGLWTYAMNYSFGCAGGGYALSVFDKKFVTRDQAFSAALNDLKSKISSRVGSTDTTNDKQPIILATLRGIETAKTNMVQLSLF
jgi:hypothetical protein